MTDMKKKTLIAAVVPAKAAGLAAAIVLGAMLLCTACGNHSRRDEIEARKAALRHKQDSTLLATQEQLALTDSALEATKQAYVLLEAEVARHRANLTATEEELTRLTQLRMHRDSLQVEWEVLGAKIKYIRRKQAEADSLH